MATETKVIISGDSSGAVNAISRLKTEFAALQSISVKALSFGGVLAGGALISGLASITKRAIDTGDALYKMSQKTGTSVEELSKLTHAAGLSGVGNEVLQKSLTALAVGLVEANEATSPAAKNFEKLGINVRDAEGKMKTSSAVLYELADRFAAMPDGVEKTNLAVDLFGKRLGAEMIPLLNSGSAGLKEMGDEAERLGLVMSGEAAKASEEFNDNLERLTKLSDAAGISLANALVPSLNKVLTEFLDAKKAGLGFVESLYLIGLSNPFTNMQEKIAEVSSDLERLKKYRNVASEATARNINLDGQIAQLEKLKAYYQAQQQRDTGDGVQSAEALAAKRVGIEKKMQDTLDTLAKLRGVAEGKISAEILLDDTKRTDAQIKNAEKLRDTLTGMWEQSLKAAAAAGDEARKLFEQAGDVRTSGADKAAAKRRSTLSPEDQQADVQKQFGTLADAASYAASLAQLADLHGRTENAAKLAAQAAKDADRAAKLADQIEDPELAARAIEQVSEIQARLIEAQAQQKQQEQAAFEAQATAQRELIAGLDQQLTELQNKAAALKVQADIAEAQGALATLQAQLENLKDKTITVTVNQVGNVPASDEAVPAGLAQPAFAGGGWTGPGSKYQIAGVVHANEHVTRSEIVRQPGALAFLARFNRIGMAALRGLPGYASGGLVRHLSIPSLAASAAPPSASATFNFPGMGSFPVQMAPDVMGELQTAFKREALKRGGRR